MIRSSSIEYGNSMAATTTSTPATSKSRLLPYGTAIERRIDGEWFHAVVVDSYVLSDGEVVYDLEYADDGNQEVGVSSSEIRLMIGTPPLKQILHKDEEEVVFVATGPDVEGGSAFVVNGEHTQLGAGGGLKGVRFLRQSVNMY